MALPDIKEVRFLFKLPLQKLHKGFTTEDFETEAQHAQTGSNLKKEPLYGNKLYNMNQQH